jgi:hypothetical protein
MSINHNRIKVADLETNLPNKILATNGNGELEFSDINLATSDSYNALDYTLAGKSLDARQGKILKDLIDNINTLLASDNINLNTLQELVDAIEVVQNSLNTILVNDLTTGGTAKALSAEMGKTLQNTKVDKVTGKNLLSDTEITRLGTLSNYTHPANHPATIITQDSSNRFVTDAEKAVWNAKQANITAGTNAQYFRGDKSWQTLDKTAVGLASVDNTADTAKNVLSATKLTTARTINGTAFDGSANITINAVDATPRIASSEKGAANGVATLDASGIILTSQLPSHIDDVLEFTNLAGFPATGETGKIYVAKDTNKIYRWSGTAYIFITSGAVDSVAGKTGVVTLAKADVGLASVDNTADAAKNVLSATKLTTARTINGTAFDGSANITITDSTKENTITAGSATQYFRGDKTWQTLDKTAAGLANVDNTTDAAKNVLSATKLTTARTINGVAFDGTANITVVDATKQATGSTFFVGTTSIANNRASAAQTLTGISIDGNSATATALQTSRTINGVAFNGSANITINAVDATPRIASSEKGAANGVATLDASGIILTSQLPSYVDDVLEYTNLAGFPATGETGKIYVAKDTNKTYRWGGTAYIYITSGAVDSVAGKTGVVTLAKADVGLASVDNTADAAKNVLSATKLTTARTINGTAFDGSANITITDSTKENSITAGAATQYFRGDKTWQTLDKTAVGLANVDNIADASKNVLSAAKLTTARTINGITFDGTANISIPINNTDKVPHQDGTRSDLNYNAALTSGFYNVNSTGTNGPGTSYNNLITVKGIDTGLQIAGGYVTDSLWFRGWGSSGSTFTPWRRLLHDGNYNSYSPTLTGAGASGTWGVNITGSAAGSAKYVDLLPGRTDVAAYPILWGVNQSTNPVTGNASTYAFSCDAVKIQSSTGTVIANNFSGSGTGLTGTAGSLNIGGNAATATRILFSDGPRTLSDRLPNSFARSVNFDFVGASTVGGSGNYGGVMTFAPWDGLSTSTGDSSYQLAFRNESGVNGSGLPGLRLRKGIDTAWGGWYDMLHSGNYAAFSAFSGAITGASLTVTGDVTAFSDARVKENIRPITNVMERIQASRGVIYDRIDTKQKDNIGFIAQELEENFPELVLTREDGTKAVKYQNAVAVLFEAIKEQQSQIEELKGLVSKLLKL